MGKKKKIINAWSDDEGIITHVQIEDNKTRTSLKKGIAMTEKGLVDAVSVTGKNGKRHLRTRPDKAKGNNLDEMARRNKEKNS